MIRAHVQIEGLTELQAGIRRAQGRLPATLGQFHREVGAFIIAKLPPGDPRAVGAGAGATVRPSATAREVLLRVGHSGREMHREQWGRRVIQPFARGRPYIVGTIMEHEEEIRRMYLDGLMAALAPAFYSAE